MDNTQLWKNTLAEIELEISKANFTTWFKDTYIIKQDNGTIYVGVPNQFVKDWLKNKYHKSLLKITRSLSESVRSIEFVVSKDKPVKKPENVNMETISPKDELPLSDLYVSKEDNLNPKYVFDSFVVGSFNDLAYAASQAIIKSPGTSYNPLFIYGQTGHGKTHLIQAVGNEIKKISPKKKIYYITSEKFSQDLVDAIQSKKMSAFKSKYRKYDLIIMDDVQFMTGKEKVQEELFHLFNTLYDNNKQIVFSSDQHPNYIQGLEERLKSRFNAGMTVDISAPDKESRVAILKTKAKLNNFILEDEIYDHIATSIEGNIRELEGALNSVVCQSQLKNKVLSVYEVKDVIKNNIKPKKTVAIKELVKIVSQFYNIDADALYKKTRKKEVVQPRQLIMYILREDFNIPYPTIGQKLGGRDHTTVIHSYEKIKRNLKTDHTLMRDVNQIRSMIP